MQWVGLVFPIVFRFFFSDVSGRVLKITLPDLGTPVIHLEAFH